jgi:ATP-dependent Clp protease ATP-binding subunit ClpC
MEMLICKSCGGDGLIKGGVCPECRGEARYVSLGGRALYWGRRISLAGIAERRVEDFLRNFVFIILAGIGMLGVAALGLEVYLKQNTDIFSADFWSAPSARLLFFYVSVWTDAYLVSKIIREMDRFRVVLGKTYGEESQAKITSFEKAAELRGQKKIDISRSFTPEAVRSLEKAFLLAHKAGYGEVRNAHLLAALLPTDDVAFLFARLGIEQTKISGALKAIIASSPPLINGVVLSEEVWNTIFSAYEIAFNTRARFVKPLELFLALARTKGKVQEMLFDLGTDDKKIENVTSWLRTVSEIRDRYRRGRRAAAGRPKGAMNRAMTAIATPALDSLSEDYTLRASYGLFPPFVDREKEMTALFRILEGGGRSVLLVGHQGTGREAFLQGLANRMAAEDVPKILQDKRLVVLSIPKLVAGATAAEAAERLEQVFYEIAVSGNIILAIPEIEGLIGISAGSGGGIDLAEILEANISKLRLLTIAVTAPEQFATKVERSSIGRAFEKLDFPEVDTDGAIQICEAKAAGIEAENHVFFSYEAIDKTVNLANRYLHDRYLPEKAVLIMREVAYAVSEKRGRGAVIGSEDVAELVSEKAKVPVASITESESVKLLGLEKKMHERVIGQDEAVTAVSSAIKRARTELRATNRPIANFLFLGPTGVGKTELAKTLAETYFGREDVMIRLDMSEYQDKTSIHRLIGLPGGETPGVLTEAVRRAPFSLVLLDEIEKAHPDILNVFLQVMDDGRLTDNHGRTVDFTNSIIIATSNAGSNFIQDSIRSGARIEEIKDALLNRELKNIFRPEFLNRFDGIIVFRPLTPDDVLKIARLMLIGVARQLEAKQIYLQVSDETVSELAAAGFDPAFGARPLRRVIQERVQDALAQGLLEGKITRRDTVMLEPGGRYRVLRNR